MPILDQYGNPVSVPTRFARAVDREMQNLPWEPVRLDDLEKLVPAGDWQALVAASRRLYFNMGLARVAVDQKAMLSVGRSWHPVFTGTDKAWGKAAEQWLMDQWYGTCDVRGSNFDFRTLLYLDSVAVDRDGDFFVLLTETADGYPQIQHIPAHRIGRGDRARGRLESGPYAGLRIENGVILNESGRPVAYRVLGEERGSYEDISARDMVHVFDPGWHEQCRGMPAAAHAITDLLSSLRSQEWEQMAQLMLSSIGLIEHNDWGGPDPDDPSFTLRNSVNGETVDGVTEQVFSGGLTRYFRANSGGKLEQLKHDRPGDVWESFQDRIARTYIVGMGWSYAYAWKSGELNGTSQRAELLKVRNAVEDRQELLRQPARRILGYAVAKAIKAGILPASADWWRWDFTMPPCISIDPGRDGKVRLDEWRAGATNMTEWLAEKGRTLEQHYRERAYEVALRKQIREEVEGAMGVEIDEREMAMLTPNDMAGGGGSAPDDGDDDDSEDPMERTE